MQTGMLFRRPALRDLIAALPAIPVALLVWAVGSTLNLGFYAPPVGFTAAGVEDRGTRADRGFATIQTPPASANSGPPPTIEGLTKLYGLEEETLLRSVALNDPASTILPQEERRRRATLPIPPGTSVRLALN